MHNRPVLCVCVFLAISVLLGFAAAGLKIGRTADSRFLNYSVRFEHYGTDAADLERTIVIPLEERLAGMAGLAELTSTCEYGKSWINAAFDPTVNPRHTYLTMRDSVDSLYRTLPGTVQKPRIYSSSTTSKPVFSAAAFTDTGLSPPGTPLKAVDVLRSHLEREVKRKLEAIDGVAEVILAGGHPEEILVELNPGRLAAGGLKADAVAQVIRDANVTAPGAVIRREGGSGGTNLVFNTRLASLEEIRALPVVLTEGKVTNLASLATVSRKHRANDGELVNINGRECVILHVKPASGGNVLAMCQDIRSVLAEPRTFPVTWQVLSDDGAFLTGLLRGLFAAISQSFVLVVVIIPLFFRSRRVLLVTAMLLPVSVFWCFALLALTGFPLDQNGLSGVSIALGLVADGALVIAETAEASPSRDAFLRANQGTVPSLTAAAGTTVLALAPLFFLEAVVPGVRSIAVTIAFMVAASLALSLTFLPCFLRGIWRGTPISGRSPGSWVLPERFFRRVERTYIRLAYCGVGLGVRHRLPARFLYAALAAEPLVIFALAGKDVTLDARAAVLPAYVEFDSDLSPEAVDRHSAELAAAVRAIPGVTYASAESRKGALELAIGFSEAAVSRADLARRVDALANHCGPGFLYVPDAAHREKGRVLPVEIAILGDENEVCRQKAREAAAILGKLPQTAQVVLNFKDPETVYAFAPHRDLLAAGGLTVYSVAESLRWMLFGPVADKWMESGGEVDIRVAGAGNTAATIATVEAQGIPTSGGAVRLAALGRLTRERAPGKIYRKDARRAAYLTAHLWSPGLLGGGADKTVALVRKTLSDAGIGGPGYGISLSRELEELQAGYRRLFLAVVAGVALMLLLLTAMTEDFRASVAIVSIIPVSAALPLAAAVFSGRALGMGDVVGMVVLGGVAVNNAIYISRSNRAGARGRVREKLQSILVTSLTTIAGAIPLALFGAAEF
ncbi:MAG: efflux RND transporter permease subunit, partial [Spirochaetaceae bacterium]|nr:efflux RND transporter permease subunit [Spirochaetaceae bacterium]